MSNLFVTSDAHLGHANIIKYCNRPFRNLEHMESEIIRRWNSRVKPGDVVLHIGDFSFKNTPGGKPGEGSCENKAQDYLKKLNGNITTLRGNHDKNNGVKSHIKSVVIEFGKMEFYLTHRPEHANENYAINLVGHVHEKWLWKYFERRTLSELFTNREGEAVLPYYINRNVILLNVGLDCHNFYPIKMTEVLNIIAKIKRNIIKPDQFINEKIQESIKDRRGDTNV